MAEDAAPRRETEGDHLRDAEILDLTSPSHQLVTLKGNADDALRAIVLQAHRMQNEPVVSAAFADKGFQKEIDARFLIVALRWFHRSCAAAAAASGDEGLRRAVAEFEQGVLHGKAKEMRDIWEHLDEYVRGIGVLQRPHRRRDLVGDRRGLTSGIAPL